VPRHHVAVALLVPQPAARDVDVLRAALGAADLERVPPHLTLVPPCSLRAADLPEALAVLRAAAAPGHPLSVRLGPVASFSPVTPTVHLAVAGTTAGVDPGGEGDGGDLVELERLQAAASRGPFERPARHAFVPHVTLLEQAALHRIRAARLALAHVAIPTCLNRVTLLAEVRAAGRGARRWVPLADVDLGGVRTLGRGGLPIELSCGTLLDPEARAVLDLPDPLPAGPPEEVSGAGGTVVVVGRMAGEVVGAAWGPGRGQRRVTGFIDGNVLSAAWLDARAVDGR
jgi:2'-5' RNA ligase